MEDMLAFAVGIEIDGPALRHLSADDAAEAAKVAWDRTLVRCGAGR